MSRLVYKVPPITALPIGAGLLQDPVTGITSVDGIAPTALSGAVLSTDVALISRNIGTAQAPDWITYYASQAEMQAWAAAGSSTSSTTPTLTAITAASLAADGATLTLTLSQAATIAGAATVTVNGVADAVTWSTPGTASTTPTGALATAAFAGDTVTFSASTGFTNPALGAAASNVAVVNHSTVTPAPNAVPGQVTGLTLSATSSNISASWNAPTSGAAVTAYEQQYRAVGSATWNTHTRNVTGNSTDLEAYFYIGISPDTDYEVVITAIAAGVEGAPSATVTTHTLAIPAPPGPTTALTAGSITSTSVFLSWTAPTSGGAPDGYQVEDRTPPGSGAWVDPFGIGGAVSCTKTGLSPSTTYEFHVFAYNAGGSGDPSPSITITTAAS